MDVSIIIVSFNAAADLARCLSSLGSAPPSATHEVIVVDNASNDGSVEAAREAGATIVASGSAAEAIPRADYVLASPPAASPLLAPLLSIVPGQLFASALARARGLDPDAPRGLSKVTLAR